MQPVKQKIMAFQSTLPVGGATCSDFVIFYIYNDFNPRSPWGERLVTSVFGIIWLVFQSTLPVGGATPG